MRKESRLMNCSNLQKATSSIDDFVAKPLSNDKGFYDDDDVDFTISLKPPLKPQDRSLRKMIINSISKLIRF